MIREFLDSLSDPLAKGSVRPLRYWYVALWAPAMRLDSDIAPAIWLIHLKRQLHLVEK